jgi:hypothetical protein
MALQGDARSKKLKGFVQVGDQLDRGDQEIEILYTLERLQREACKAGGALHILNGNHETMNIAQDMRYGTLGASVGLARAEAAQNLGNALKRRCGCLDGWTAVMKEPGMLPWPNSTAPFRRQP